MKSKAILISILVIVMSLFVGVVAAQDDGTADSDRPNRERGLLNQVVNIVTDATGLTGQEILDQLRDGATLSEVITNAGGDVDAVMAEVEAQFAEQIETLFNTEFDFAGRDGGAGIRDRVQNGVMGVLASTVSETTGLEFADIVQQIRDGATLADIITNNGGNIDIVIATVIDEVTTTVNERVAEEQITQEQADTILENLEETLTDWINGDTPFPNRGQRGNRGNN